MIKYPFALLAACSLATSAYAVDPTPAPKAAAPAKAAPAPVYRAPAPAPRPAPAPVTRAPAPVYHAPAPVVRTTPVPAPRVVQSGPTAQQQAASKAEMAKSKARVVQALPATGPVVTTSTRTASTALTEAQAKPTVPAYKSKSAPVTVPSPVSSYNRTNDPKIEAGYQRQQQEYAARQAAAAKAKAAQAAAEKAKQEKPKRQMWDKPPGS
jgi:hypothetical protein